ncbi:MAG: ATP-binding protein [Acidimicrobiia bacterium]
MALRPITETCRARSDVLAGGLTDAHFAAQLDQVVRDPGKYKVYGDPTEFFAITYPTDGLKRLLSSTFGRLSGEGGKVEGAEHGVVRFQTSFGGGKTHGLIAAYHLAKGARPPAIGEFVDPDLLPDDCRVAAVVGDALDASGMEVNGRMVHTMWGAIAAQLGGPAWEAIRELDETRSAPSTNTWLQTFGDAPTLVIIDEVAAHMRALSSSADPERRRQAQAMPVFLFSLFTAAAQVDTARVVITLATQTDAFAKETADVEKMLDTDSGPGQESQSVMSRFREVLVPAEDEEIAAIIRRRLFSHIDETAAIEAADGFRDYYSAQEKGGHSLNFSADTHQRMAASYPLHPELVRVLDSRVGTIPAFQRTRGALRLLAETVSALWERKADAVVINVADVPLDASPVGNALTRGIDREAFAQVIAADVAGPGSHAAVVDQTRFAATKPYATRAATTVFLHSLEQTASRGATQVDVWRGTLVPGDDPDLIQEALTQLDLHAWHLDYDGARWRFDTEAQPRKIVEDEKLSVAPSLVREEVDRRIGQMFAPQGAVKTRIFPKGPGDVDDRSELQLAVIHYDDLEVTARNASPPADYLIDMLDTHGVAGSNRTFRNGVAFLVSDSDQIESMKDAVRWDLAAHRVKNNGERMSSYAEPVQNKLKQIADKAGLDARVAITRCYRHLYYPKADKANRHLRHHELSPTSQGDQVKNQTIVIQEALQSLGKIRDTPIASDFLARIAGFPATDRVSTSQAVEGFWRDHNAEIVLNPVRLTETVAVGIRNGEWIYYDSEAGKAYTADTPPPAARISTTTYLYTKARAEAEGLLRRDPTWADVEKELTKAKGELEGSELRSRLEQTLGDEPTKTILTEILGRVLKQEPVPIIVIDGSPSADSKPLAASTMSKLPLERITILSRSRAEEIGIEVTARPTGFKLNGEGSAGPVFGTLTDKLAELGTGKRITRVAISKTVTTASTAELRTLLSAVPMLPKLDFEIRLNASGSYLDLSGEVQVAYLAGPAAGFRKVEKEIFALLDRAGDLTAGLTLTCALLDGIEPGSEAWKTLASTMADLKPGEISVEVSGQ